MNKFDTNLFLTHARNLRREVVELLSSTDLEDRELAERLNNTLPVGVRVPLKTVMHQPMRWRIS